MPRTIVIERVAYLYEELVGHPRERARDWMREHVLDEADYREAALDAVRLAGLGDGDYVVPYGWDAYRREMTIRGDISVAEIDLEYAPTNVAELVAELVLAGLGDSAFSFYGGSGPAQEMSVRWDYREGRATAYVDGWGDVTWSGDDDSGEEFEPAHPTLVTLGRALYEEARSTFLSGCDHLGSDEWCDGLAEANGWEFYESGHLA